MGGTIPIADAETQALERLYDQLADRLHHFLTVRLGSRHDADEVLQETFLRLVRQRSRLTRVESLPAYAFTVARNEASRYLQKTQRQSSRLGEMIPVDDLYVTTPGPDSDEAEIIAQALASLSPPQREVVELKIYGELTFREIADVTQLAQGTVASRYRVALQHLSKTLSRVFDEPAK